MQKTILVSLVALSLGSFACSHDEKPAAAPAEPYGASAATTSPSNPTATTTLDTAPADPQMQAAAHPSANPAPPAPPLTDAQIAAITDAANTGEVDAAKLALTKSSDAKVKQFAQMMISHHGDAKTQQGVLLSKLKMNPESNATSEALTKGSTDALGELRSKSGSEFDRAYVDLQVKQHRDVLALLDEKLLPAVANADFKKALTDVRAKVAQHLAAAETLQRQVNDKKTAT
jgi:putative membrane protein